MEISVFHRRRPISRKMSRPWNRELSWSLLIADHIVWDRKCKEKRNTVDRQSILNIKLIGDQQIGDQIWFDWRWKNRT